MRTTLLFLLALVSALILANCGGGNNPMLQSISISPGSPTGSAQFVATGTYSNGKTITPLPVNWFIIAVPDVDPAPAYSLNAAPFAQLCPSLVAGSFLVTAFAPQNPNAPSSGGMPLNVWEDMIHATVQSEGGFVNGSAHLNCP